MSPGRVVGCSAKRSVAKHAGRVGVLRRYDVIGVRRACRVSEMFNGLCLNQAEVAVNTIVQLCAFQQRLRGGTNGGCHAEPISKKDVKEICTFSE